MSDRLMLLARFGARIAHENLFDAAVNIDGEEPTEGHENHGGPSWGFDTCPHGDCVMVRSAASIVSSPQDAQEPTK